MNKLLITIVSIVMLLSAENANATLIETVEWNGTTYGLLSAGTWQNVQADAESLNGDLVTINSEAEQDFLFNLWGNGGTSNNTFVFLWIGFNDFASEGNFVWASGELSNFTHWIEDEPNNEYNDEHGVWMQRYTGALDNGGTVTNGIGWNDARSSVSFIGGVVEFPSNASSSVPEPSTVAIFALGMIGLASRRFKK